MPKSPSVTAVQRASSTLAKVSILQSLLASEWMYGTKIAQLVLDRTQGKVLLSHGSLYPLLSSFLEDGLIETESGVYRLTRLGRKIAEEQKEVLCQLLALCA